MMMMGNVLAGISEPTDPPRKRNLANPNTMRPQPPLSSQMSNSDLSNLWRVCSIGNKNFSILASLRFWYVMVEKRSKDLEFGAVGLEA